MTNAELNSWPRAIHSVSMLGLGDQTFGAVGVAEPSTNSRVTLLANTNNTDIVYDFPYRGIFMAHVGDLGISLLTVIPANVGEPEIPANFINLQYIGA